MKLFIILGNQLFPLKYLNRFKKDHLFFMAEDNGLCTYEKHHKLKILLFLSSMRSFYENLKKNSFKITYSKAKILWGHVVFRKIFWLKQHLDKG